MRLRGLTRRQLLIGSAAGLTSCALAACVGSRRTPEYDLCVVGSGFAGIPLALRAVEHGLSTVVVEAGSELAASFNFTNSGALEYPIGATRLIAAGGASGHWAGVTTRLRPVDFMVRSTYGDLVDWPLRYEDLEPYYCEAEHLLSVRGWPVEAGAEPMRSCSFPKRFEPAYRGPELAIDEKSFAFFGPSFSERGAGPVRLADHEIPHFVQSPLGTFLEGRRVTEIVTLDGESVHNVSMRDKRGAESTVTARFFVIAAGTVETSRLLMMSRSSWFPDGIGNSHGLVGRYFNYHPEVFGSFDPGVGRQIPGGYHRTHSLDDELRRQGLNACNFHLNSKPNGRIVVRLSPEIEPAFENRLTLSAKRRDPLSLPSPDLRFHHTDRDRRTFERMATVGEEIRTVLGGTQPLSYRRRFQSHPAGSCRMALDERAGVVDANNKVFGVENLYVSGACTFPLSGATNPTDTVVALTLRLADHLAARSRA